MAYEAILLVSFGGPEGHDEVMPFLENVLRGRNVPRERMLAVAQHYYHFGGKSPINDHNRQLIAALRQELDRHQLHLPVYWGNRNWHPLLPETLRQMKADGIKQALAFVTAAYSSYSSCRQYRENIAAAQQSAGDGAPAVEKLRVYFNHPGFITASAERVREAMSRLSPGSPPQLVFTAHSIPAAMAATCRYAEQLREASRLVAESVGLEWELVFQSRSGPASQPWLEPDVLEYLRQFAARPERRPVVIVPIGFVSDHMEILYDLDTEAHALCRGMGVEMVRAATVGTHPRFVSMIRELIQERMSNSADRLALDEFGASHDVCPQDCCPAPVRPVPPLPASVTVG
jgi:ferrochelatase